MIILINKRLLSNKCKRKRKLITNSFNFKWYLCCREYLQAPSKAIFFNEALFTTENPIATVFFRNKSHFMTHQITNSRVYLFSAFSTKTYIFHPFFGIQTVHLFSICYSLFHLPE